MARYAHPNGEPDPAADINTPSSPAQRSSPPNPNSNSKDTNTNTNTPSATPKPAPYRTLLHLPNMPKPSTPQARTPSARLGSARRLTVMTPHGRAAIREVEARRAGFTPGQDRRRSGRQQRETPRDTLRALSKLLAPKTKPTVRTPPVPTATEGKVTVPRDEDFDDDDDDDGYELQRPRLSLPMGDEEDDSLLEPPRSSGLEDENFTVRSVEHARRAAGRLSRGSFGSIGTSDQFADLNESGLDVGGVFDSSFAVGDQYGDDQMLGMDDGFQGDTTEQLGDAALGGARLSLAGSDIRPGLLADDTENTFVFTVPERDVPDLQRSDDTVESSTRDDGEKVDWGEMSAVAPNNADDGRDAVREDVDLSMFESVLEDADTTVVDTQKPSRKKRVKVSKHGTPYPSLPAGVVKKLATTYARTGGNSKAKISKDTLDAIMQASDWFFEQVSDDLGAYAEHAGRKTIEESDAITLMRRQRQINDTTTPFSVAQKFLPRELLQDLRMVPPAKAKRARQLARVDEADGDTE